MGRPAINPAKKKRTVSITLTPEQCQLLLWSAAEVEQNTSVFVGQLIEREARKISKQKQKPLPDLDLDLDQQQIKWTADGQVQARRMVRQMCQDRTRK